jgi:hypothetical protein
MKTLREMIDIVEAAQQGVAEGSEIAQPGQLVQIIQAPRMLDLLPGETFEVRSSNAEGVTLKHGMGTKFDNVVFPHGTYKIVNAQGLREFAPGGNFKPPAPPKKKGDDPWGNDDRSKILQSVKQLLQAGNKVDWKVPGQMGHVVRVSDDSVILKRWNRPYSKINYSLMLTDDQDDQYLIQMVKPGHYKVVSSDSEWQLEEQGVAEGQGDFDKALDTLSGSYSGWYPDETQSEPGVKTYWYDDGEGGFYADGRIEHNLRTGEITVSFVDKDGYHGGDVEGTFKNMGDAMRALRGGGGNHGGRAPNYDRLGSRTQHGPDDLRKTDRTGRKGTVGGGFANARKASIQHNLGKHGPKGVLPEASPDALATIDKLTQK